MASCKYMLLIGLVVVGCNNTADQKLVTGEMLAKTYCGSCHVFPEPVLLDKATWKDKVLPPMARQLGIDNIFETAIPGQQTAITIKEWKQILAYYLTTAPVRMPVQQRPPVKELATIFTTRQLLLKKDELPATSFIKIDEANHWVIAANVFDSSVNVYDPKLRLIRQNRVKAPIVDIEFNDAPGPERARNGTLTNIGIMNPNDRQAGSAIGFTLTADGRLVNTGVLFDSVPRPVQVTRYDLDQDGRYDYLVCGFGNARGSLYWMQARADGNFDKMVLAPQPGSIRAAVEDLTKDGLPDIIVLMAQARESILLFTNEGNGRFASKKLLEFPPVYGSSYFELDDFNKDGFKDLLYTCGDNDDYSSGTLKNYHGIYLFLNDGNKHFSQRYFFPVHGCYKAMAADFDKDGDLDIAAISFFPDGNNQPQESFIYLEQTTPFHFAPFTIRDFDAGRWITMDCSDLDGDGYQDIVLGSLVPPLPGKIAEWKNAGRQKTSILLLHNKGTHPGK